MKLTESAKLNCLLVFEYWGADVRKASAFWDAIETDAKLVEELNSYPELTDPSNYGLDTYDREWMMSVVTEQIIGMDWPVFGDSDEVKLAFQDAMKNCEVFECANW